MRPSRGRWRWRPEDPRNCPCRGLWPLSSSATEGRNLERASWDQDETGRGCLHPLGAREAEVTYGWDPGLGQRGVSGTPGEGGPGTGGGESKLLPLAGSADGCPGVSCLDRERPGIGAQEVSGRGAGAARRREVARPSAGAEDDGMTLFAIRTEPLYN